MWYSDEQHIITLLGGGRVQAVPVSHHHMHKYFVITHYHVSGCPRTSHVESAGFHYLLFANLLSQERTTLNSVLSSEGQQQGWDSRLPSGRSNALILLGREAVSAVAMGESLGSRLLAQDVNMSSYSSLDPV